MAEKKKKTKEEVEVTEEVMNETVDETVEETVEEIIEEDKSKSKNKDKKPKKKETDKPTKKIMLVVKSELELFKEKLRGKYNIYYFNSLIATQDDQIKFSNNRVIIRGRFYHISQLNVK